MFPELIISNVQSNCVTSLNRNEKSGGVSGEIIVESFLIPTLESSICVEMCGRCSVGMSMSYKSDICSRIVGWVSSIENLLIFQLYFIDFESPCLKPYVFAVCWLENE